jgi:hypothetical protein
MTPWLLATPTGPLRRRLGPRIALAGFALTALATATTPAETFASAITLAAPSGTSEPEGAMALQQVGLSAVRAQSFENQNFGSFPAAAFERYGEILAAGDFNGDGTADLAAGTPDDDGLSGGGTTDTGSVTIRYGVPAGAGVPGGLHAGPPDALFQQSSVLDLPETGDRFGSSLASCDFDDDGFDDHAIGIPDEDILGDTNAGAVEIHHGGAAGLSSAAAKMFLLESSGFPVLPIVPLQFGLALACGDFDGDGFADLAIGTPNSSPVATLITAGVVYVARGSGAGLVTTGSRVLHEDTPDMPGLAEDFDRFGFALAAGNFDGDNFTDLAIGSPGETIGGQLEAGAVHVLLGSAGGLQPLNSTFLGDTSIGGASELNDQFAATVATADFDADGFDDLAIGAPTESFGAIESVGQVAVLYGQAAAPAFDLARTQFLNQDGIYGGGAGESADFFGQALAAGDFDGDGHADLAIGHPEESLGHAGDGALTVVMGSGDGLDPVRHREIDGGKEGFPGDAEEGDRGFAYGLAAGDFDGDGHFDLAISSPRADVGDLDDAGAITALYGSLFADGFGAQGMYYWSAASVGGRASESVRPGHSRRP